MLLVGIGVGAFIYFKQDAAKAMALPVTGVSCFDSAQVTAGGVSTAEFYPETMESRIVPGGEHNEASWEKQVPFFMDVLFYDL